MIRGKRKFDRRMKAAIRMLGDARPAFRKVSQYMEREYKRNMTRGVDPDGRSLAPVTKWTRTIRAGIGEDVANSRKPLVATGQLRNSIGSTDIGPRSMRFGFHGNQSRKAEDMYYGNPGKMRVKSDIIRTSDGGDKYIRYKHGGKWITEPESQGRFDGSHIRVNPRARKFFYLGRQQADKACDIMFEFVDGNL